jgi:hemerythrin-like domain-containing protein
MNAPANPQSHHQSLPQSSGETVAQILMREHGMILLALGALEEMIDDMEAGDAPDRADFEKAVDFLRTFADRDHNGKEEDILFKTMLEDLDYSKNVGPVAVLSTEHVKTRELIREIAEAAAALDQDPAAPQRLIASGRGYLKLQRRHIDREDHVVFPMVEQFLDEADQARLTGKLGHLERQEIESGRRGAAISILEEIMRRGSDAAGASAG